MLWIHDDEDFVPALKALGIPAKRVELRPFVQELEGRGLNAIDEGTPVFVRGPFGLPEACEKRGWRPIVWTGECLSERAVMTALGSDYLNADGAFMSLTDLPSADFGGNEVFVKPVEDSKVFGGQRVVVKDAQSWLDGMRKSGYLREEDQNIEIFCAPVKRLGCEWRFFVVGGEIADGCCYRQYGKFMPERWVPEGVETFVKDAISRYDPLPGFVLDVVQVEDGTYRVIELNTINHAGVYACEPERIITAIEKELAVSPAAEEEKPSP